MSAAGDGGTATYTGGNGTNALTFSSTVGAGQNTADLAVTAVNLGTAAVKDGAGNAAKFASDGKGGTIVYDPPVPAGKNVNTTAENLANDSVVSALNQQLAL